MIKAEIRYILLIVILLVAGGCYLPRPPQAVNVQLPDNVPIYAYHQERAGRANAGVLAYCEDVKEYAKTVQGDWEKHWYQIVCRVIKVTAGKWKDTNLIFVCYDSWPTPESGIVLGKALFPYRQGMVFHFWIDTSKKSPLIIAQQVRSRIPPHGLVRPPSGDFKDPETKKIFEQVTDAASMFIKKQKEPIGALCVTEEHDEFFVVENFSASESLTVTVDKNTYKVRWVQPLSE